MRLLVRERLLAGDSNEEVVQYIVDRYGEYVLLTPKTTGSNLVLWLAGPLMLVFGGAIGALYLRRRSQATPEAEKDVLSQDESERLRHIMDE
jgi:cytochrome c-type biogenesis protein CcmH